MGVAHRCRLVAALSLVCLGTFACKKKEGGPAAGCPPLKITVDGQPLQLPSAFGIKDQGKWWQVELFSHDKHTCDTILKKARAVHPGEVSARAFLDPTSKGPLAQSVGLGFHTQGMVRVDLAQEPKQAGDMLALCVPNEVSFSPAVGSAKGKKVVIHGLFQGRFCGNRS
jgi:hypothetical protein